MNRSPPTDSNSSLDVRGRRVQDQVMEDVDIYLERREPGRNMARFYRLTLGPSLFGCACLCRRWGRIGGRGVREIVEFPADEAAALNRLDRLRKLKMGRGYRPVPDVS